MWRMARTATTAAALALAGAPAIAAETLDGPVPARVLRVIDGDTVAVRARIWLGQDVEIRVRLEGVDAPELRGRCARERVLAARARDFLVRRLDDQRVRLRAVRYDKYGGRVLARIESAAGEDLGAALIAAGLARPYAGGARAPWCRETARRPGE